MRGGHNKIIVTQELIDQVIRLKKSGMTYTTMSNLAICGVNIAKKIVDDSGIDMGEYSFNNRIIHRKLKPKK